MSATSIEACRPSVRRGLIVGAFVADEWLPATEKNFPTLFRDAKATDPERGDMVLWEKKRRNRLGNSIVKSGFLNSEKKARCGQSDPVLEHVAKRFAERHSMGRADGDALA